ncbi:putative glucuronosyltransferase [Helianthus anomalus]
MIFTDIAAVVYLDADTIVVKNIDVLFKCGKFCANLKHSERLNSGVMVVELSEEHFNDMVRKVTTLKSYTGGDQGFLNAYYTGFPSACVFDPNISTEEVNSKPAAEMERLSALYNADVGLYMLANKEVREHLEESLPGIGGGRNPHDHLLFANGANSMVPDYLGGISVLVCFVAAVVSLGFGFSVVPRQVKPWTSLIMMYEWIFTIFFLLFGCYLHMIYKWGKWWQIKLEIAILELQITILKKVYSVSCDVAPWYYGLGMAFLAVAAPLIPGILRLPL